MTANKKKKSFLKYPELSGGSAEFRKFIKENLVYPAEALEKKIEGIVFLSYEVNDNGEVLGIKIEKGIGHGCDEEAERLIRLLKFKKVKNRGVRLKSTKKARIVFRLGKPSTNVSYEYKPKPKPVQKETPKTPATTVYSYTINIG